MVLIRTLITTLVVMSAACGQSLFDAHGDRGGDGSVGDDDPLSCPATCLANAGSDFDGSMMGRDNHWRYLNDLRNRNWTPMDPGNNALVGSDGNDRIAACAGSSEPACAKLPGALLITAKGALEPDPAIEYESPIDQVIRIKLAAYSPGTGVDQRIRLYRNSREDVLFTGTAAPGGDIITNDITVDALAHDRFLVAIEPIGLTAAGGDVALHLFISKVDQPFPSRCQLALTFDGVSGNQVTNLCASQQKLSYLKYNSGATAPINVSTASGPILGRGQSVSVMLDHYFMGGMTDFLQQGPLTIQFWAQHQTLSATKQFLFSNLDRDLGGGLAMSIFNIGTPMLLVISTSPGGTTDSGDLAPYPAFPGWHFLRVVAVSDTVAVCIDGKRAMIFPYPTDKLVSSFPVHLGKNVNWSPDGAFFQGNLDDVRVFSDPLPCN